MKIFIFIVLVTALLSSGLAQTVEDWIESAEYPDELQDWLTYLQEHPLNLNRSTVQQVASLPFFNDDAATVLIRERDQRQGFEAISDVLALNGLSDAQRKSLSLFTTVSVARTTQGSARIRSTAGITKRSSEPLHDEDWEARTNADFHADSGTKGFLFGYRRSGTIDLADGVSAGLELPAKGQLPRIVAGDFQNEVGSGLVFASAYGLSNWLSAAESTEPGKVHGLISRPTTNRLSQYRGIALSKRSAHVQVSALYSDHPLDAVLDSSGLIAHMSRSPSTSPEANRARKDQIRETLLGTAVEGGTQTMIWGLTAYRARYSPAFVKDTTANDVPSLSGSKLDLGSVFSRGSYKGMTWLAELARSNPGGSAYQVAIGFGNKRFGSVLYHVNVDADFFSPHAKIWSGFGGGVSMVQVTGVRLHSAWTDHSLNVDCQTQKTPASTTVTALPKNSYSLEVRWQVKILDQLRVEILGGRKLNERTSTTLPSHEYRLDRARLEAIVQTVQEFKFRFEIRSMHDHSTNRSALGTALYLQVKIPVQRFDIFGRVTLFDMESSDVSMSVYENSLTGSSSIVPLSGSGRRLSITVQRQWSFLSAGIKLGHTVSSDRANGHENSELALEIAIQR